MYPTALSDHRDRSLPTLPMPLGSAQPLLLIVPWTTVAQGLMGPFLVIPPNPLRNGSPCIGETPKLVLPDTFFLQRSEPALNQSILFRSVQRNELLWQPVEPTRVPKAPTLKDQAIITAHNWHLATWSQGAKPCQARHFKRPFRFVCPPAQRELPADNFPIVAINDRNQMAPSHPRHSQYAWRRAPSVHCAAWRYSSSAAHASSGLLGAAEPSSPAAGAAAAPFCG